MVAVKPVGLSECCFTAVVLASVSSSSHFYIPFASLLHNPVYSCTVIFCMSWTVYAYRVGLEYTRRNVLSDLACGLEHVVLLAIAWAVSQPALRELLFHVLWETTGDTYGVQPTHVLCCTLCQCIVTERVWRLLVRCQRATQLSSGFMTAMTPSYEALVQLCIRSTSPLSCAKGVGVSSLSGPWQSAYPQNLLAVWAAVFAKVCYALDDRTKETGA